MPSRCFIAVDVTESVRDTLDDARGVLSAGDPAWASQRWVPRELLHVTLKFIGPLPDASLGDVVAALSTDLARAHSLTWSLAGVRAVPNAGRATMLWARLAGDGEASASLHAAVEAVLEEGFGVEADGRPYTPHVTLVRSRRPRRVRRAALDAVSALVADAGKGPDGTVSVRSLTLYSSTLGQGGPTYRAVGLVPLGG